MPKTLAELFEEANRRPVPYEGLLSATMDQIWRSDTKQDSHVGADAESVPNKVAPAQSKQ